MSTAQLPQVQAHDYSELGPIAQLVTNPQVTEIMVMGARDIYVEIGGKILLTPLSFASDEELMVVGGETDRRREPVVRRAPG